MVVILVSLIDIVFYHYIKDLNSNSIYTKKKKKKKKPNYFLGLMIKVNHN